MSVAVIPSALAIVLTEVISEEVSPAVAVFVALAKNTVPSPPSPKTAQAAVPVAKPVCAATTAALNAAVPVPVNVNTWAVLRATEFDALIPFVIAIVPVPESVSTLRTPPRTVVAVAVAALVRTDETPLANVTVVVNVAEAVAVIAFVDPTKAAPNIPAVVEPAAVVEAMLVAVGVAVIALLIVVPVSVVAAVVIAVID